MIKPLDPMPSEWRYQLVDVLAKRGSGHTPDREKQQYWNGGIKWVSLTDSDKLDRRWIYQTNSEISQLGIRHSSAVLHPANTVIVSRDAGVGKSAVLFEPMAVSQHFIAWRCGPELEPFLLYYWLQYNKAFFERMAVGSTIQTIGLGVFKKLAGSFPPYSEQRKIADILTTWDEALEKIDTLIEAKERRKKALMQQLLTGKRRVPGFTKSWVRHRFDDLLKPQDRYVEFKDEHTYRLASIRRRSGGVFFREALNGGDIKTKVMKLIHTGDFLISRMQVVHGALGMVRPVCDGMYASDSYDVMVTKDPNLLHMPFLDWMSRLRSFWHLAYISSHGVHIEKMTFKLSDFMHEKINIPEDIEEQRKIATILDTCDEELAILKKQRAVIDKQKRGLMQRLLTGRIRVSC